MAEVFLGVGSNINARANMSSAFQVLADSFRVLKTSSIYESDAVGFEGARFLNAVVQIETAMSVEELQSALRLLEMQHGAVKDAPKLSSRALDIDILLYDEKVGNFGGVMLPREEILLNAFVLWPLAEIVPQYRHPIAHKTYESLWQCYDKKQQKIEKLA